MAVAAERIVDITRALVCEAPPTYRSEPNRIRRAGCRWYPSVEHCTHFSVCSCLKRHFSSADSIWRRRRRASFSAWWQEIRYDAPPTRSVLHTGRYAPNLRRYSRKPERVDKRNWSLWSFAQWMTCA